MAYPAMWQGSPVQYSQILASSAASVNIVPAQFGQQIVILAFGISGNGTLNVTWQSQTTTSVKVGPLYLGANTLVNADYSPGCLFATVNGEGLNLLLSAAIAVGGYLVWAAVDVQLNPPGPGFGQF